MNHFSISDLKIGHKESFKAEITAEMMQAYEKITGDISPIHIDENFAREKGFKGRVVYGLLTSSFYSTLVGVYLPGSTAILQSVDVSLVSVVYIGDTLEISGEVSAIHEGFKQIELKVRIRNQEGATISRGKIKVGVREQ